MRAVLRLALPALALTAILALPGAAGEPDPCARRNPLHCHPQNEPDADAKAVPATSPEEPSDPDVIVDPPGGCTGRNPLYCRETAPEVKPAPPEPTPRQRANPRSGNPNRNPKPNPNRNPRRRDRSGD